VYKCVARIKEGRVSCEARLLLGGKTIWWIIYCKKNKKKQKKKHWQKSCV
jgi:hypothetical protein